MQAPQKLWFSVCMMDAPCPRLDKAPVMLSTRVLPFFGQLEWNLAVKEEQLMLASVA